MGKKIFESAWRMKLKSLAKFETNSCGNVVVVSADATPENMSTHASVIVIMMALFRRFLIFVCLVFIFLGEEKSE